MDRVRTVRDVLLRPSTESELPRLSELTEVVYGVRREPEVLRWLLFHPGPGPEVESSVAERHGRIVGHVASLHCRYWVHGGTVTGAHRMLWMVEHAARGRAGVPLAGRTPDTDFEVVLGGTAATKAMLVMRGFREAGEALEVRLSTAAAGSATTRPTGLELVDFDPAAAGPGAPRDTLVNLAEPDHLAWLAACPEHDGLLFTLQRSGEPLGPVLLYVNRANDPPTGRIVHMPCLEEDAALALLAILDRLGREGCAEATVLTTEDGLLRATESLGGEVFYRRPLWFRNPNRAVEPVRFYLTYMEGDLAYRRV
ncbi:MAG: GNAT family N-acetyltransferase [Holophagales bacterium]|nr:GNAT family N-acetyltransferase [Holophagales bacterium]MYC09485.1 GNAT family N-acetyltransferase [Holophagales bacterium]